MNPEEYDKLLRIEKAHWFYAGKRQLARWAIETFGGKQGKSVELLDCGAGTGCFADEVRDDYRVRVLDDHAESLELLRKKFAAEDIIEGSATSIPVGDGSLDVVTLMDVLEHVEDDQGALGEIHRVLRPEGVLVLTVPALRQLWSKWDECLHHFRRYQREDLIQLFDPEKWEICHLKYVNIFVYPFVWWVRRSPFSDHSGSSENFVPPAWINGFLRWVFVSSAKARWLPAPLGVGLFLVARRRA
ncbi:MAG: class I SAM-dependent methyltransferase [Synoicihabitans sp.]